MGAGQEYNLLDKPWIPVLYRDGRYARVGIVKALEDAGEIREIAASNPMDRVSILRFLMALLVWYGRDSGDYTQAMAGGIPAAWLEKLNADRPCFELLGDGKRFYQDRTILDDLLGKKQQKWDQSRKKAKTAKAPRTPRPVSLDDDDFRPASDLLAEYPGADSVNHLRHVVHGTFGFCPACCVTGMLRLSVWASANDYLPSSINPPSAVYAVPAESDLATSLRVGLPDSAYQASEPPWRSDEQPVAAETASALAWRPRRIWLGDADLTGFCENCGEHGLLIRQIAFARGWDTPMPENLAFGKMVANEFRALGFPAKDPKVKKAVDAAWVILKCRTAALQLSPSAVGANTSSDAVTIARSLRDLMEQDAAAFAAITKRPSKEETDIIGELSQKKYWQDDPHLVVEAQPVSLPALSSDVASHVRRWRMNAARANQGKQWVIGPVVNKFSYHDACCEPIGELDTSTLLHLEAMEPEVSSLLKGNTRNPKRRHPEISANRSALSPQFEKRVRQVICATVANDNCRRIEGALSQQVKDVVNTTTPGSQLRRRLGQAAAEMKLAKLSQKVKAKAAK